MDCKTVFNFKVLLVSVLFCVTATSSIPIASEDPGDQRLDNPCSYVWNHGNEKRHGKHAWKGKREASEHIAVHLHFVINRVNRSLQDFEKNYQESKLIHDDRYNLKAGKACSKLMAYRNLQVYMRALDLMRNQSFTASDSWNKEDRESNITNVLNQSTNLLCEFYDDLHHHNLTKQVKKVAYNSKVTGVRDKIKTTIQRTDLSTQDRVVFKQFKKFLKNMEVLFKSGDKKKCKLDKKGDKRKKKTKNKKRDRKLSKNKAARRKGSS